METAEVVQEQQPDLHENTLKAKRFAERYVSKNTEAVIVINKNGRYALMDMQKPGSYQVRPDELLNERWREVLPRPAKVQKQASAEAIRVLGDEHTGEPVLNESLPNPVIPKPLETALKTVANDSKPAGKISGKQS